MTVGGADSEGLDENVLEQIARLGARAVRDAQPSPVQVGWRDQMLVVPRAIVAFARELLWPAGHSYDGSVLWERDLRLVRFGGLTLVSPDFACAARRPYATVAEYDGGDYRSGRRARRCATIRSDDLRPRPRRDRARRSAPARAVIGRSARSNRSHPPRRHRSRAA